MPAAARAAIVAAAARAAIVAAAARAGLMLIASLIGFALGFLGSVPVAGPIAALVFSRGVAGRFRSGVFIALGGGIAEAGYAFLAFWGFSTYLTEYPLVVPISRGLAAVVLTALGVSFVRTRTGPAAPKGEPPADTAAASFLLGLTITGVNPTLIATWTAAVTALYSAEVVSFSRAQALPFAFGTCLGIAGWFCTLLALIRRYRQRLKDTTLARVVRLVGVFLLLLALWFALRFVQFFAEPPVRTGVFFGPTHVCSVAVATISPARSVIST